VLPYLHLGPLTVGTFGLLMWAAFVAAYLVLRADFRRRRLPGEPETLIVFMMLAGITGAKLWHVLERPRELMSDPAGIVLSRTGFAWFGGLIAGSLTLLYLARRWRIPTLTFLDACSPAAALGYAVGRIGCLISGDGDYGVPTSLPWGMSFPHGLVPTTERVHPTPIYEFLVNAAIFYYLWRRGQRGLRQPRPQGEVVAEYFIFTGAARFLVEFIRINPRVILGMSNAQAMGLVSTILGIILLQLIRRRSPGEKAEHRILRHVSQRGQVVQREYHPATPECPHPERWKMFDRMTAEVEVLAFLGSLVTTIKPQLVLETGTFMAISTLAIAEALQENGFGKVITCESDPVVFAKARERIQASGLGRWIDCRNESSLETAVDGQVDLLFSDSDYSLREAEVRRFLPQISPHGLILMHDASSDIKTVREAALRLEREGLISVVLLPTPRGLAIAQKRDGHG